jgi:F-type H+-transporting ATPase subunit delta
MAAATVAGVYAAALLELATERGAVEAVVADCRQLAGGLSADSLMALDDPRIGKARAKGVLAQTAEGAHELVLRMLLLLVDRNRLADAPAILAEVVRQAETTAGVLHVVVTTASAVGSDVHSKILERIRSHHGARAEVEERVDPALIGGFTARIGDTYLDASVRRRLDDLTDRMNQVAPAPSLWAET